MFMVYIYFQDIHSVCKENSVVKYFVNHEKSETVTSKNINTHI